MTIQTLSMAVLMPAPINFNGQATSAPTNMRTIMTFDGSADRLAIITWIVESRLLTNIEFRTGTVSTAGATFSIRIEGVDTSGNPDGVLKYTNANGTVVVGTGDDNVWKSVPINSGVGVNVAKGDQIAIVLTVSSGTPNTVIIAGAPTIGGWVYGEMPYLVQDTGGGTWARLASSSDALCLVFNDDGNYWPIPGGTVINSMTVQAIGNDAERGLRFLTPWPMRLTGVRVRLPNLTAGSAFRARIYGPDTTTVLAESISSSVDIDGDVVLGATQDSYYDIIFPESPQLSANTEYVAAIWQKNANAVNLIEISTNGIAYTAAMSCGDEFYLVNRAAGGTGAWSTDRAARPDLSLWIDGFDDGAGSGGGMIRHPGMSGGMNA